jgi:hypothetical protein
LKWFHRDCDEIDEVAVAMRMKASVNPENDEQNNPEVTDDLLPSTIPSLEKPKPKLWAVFKHAGKRALVSTSDGPWHLFLTPDARVARAAEYPAWWQWSCKCCC